MKSLNFAVRTKCKNLTNEQFSPSQPNFLDSLLYDDPVNRAKNDSREE